MENPLSGETPDYRSLLRRLGLQADHIWEALGASNTERNLCASGHCSKSAAGYYAYNGMLTSLSRQMTSDRWKRNDPMSMPLLVNDDFKTVVSVKSGDQYTGLNVARQQPTTRNPIGELTKALVRNNYDRDQLVLLDIARRSVNKDLLESISDYRFLLVMVFFDKEYNQIRCEISEPEQTNVKGYITGWSRRIHMPPYELGDIDFGGDDPNEGFDPINVPLSRR